MSRSHSFFRVSCSASARGELARKVVEVVIAWASHEMWKAQVLALALALNLALALAHKH